jgi:hypothetical protein
MSGKNFFIPFTVAVILVFAALQITRADESQTPSANSASPKKSSERFDDLVREDFFAAMSGDLKSFNRAMKVCEDALEKDPKHAQAMVWHGSGLLYLSGQVFRTNNIPFGISLWQRGLKEMDQAVALEPQNISVLVPRGATLIPAARYTPDPAESKRLLKLGVTDYENVLRIQTPIFATLSTHSRGELLFGLADGWFRLGDTNKSRAYLQRIVKDCAESAYAKKAESWLATSDPKVLREKSNALTCMGCHAK